MSRLASRVLSADGFGSSSVMGASDERTYIYIQINVKSNKETQAF
jgi:hypothetical protein